MKNINIISEAIYKGQHKLVNQGAFINFSDLIDDIFSCNGLTCACNGNKLQKSDIFIRKAYLSYSQKKPGANWTSLEKMVKDVYNCCAGEALCPSKKEQWWITTDVIRPRKTIETINFTNLIVKVLTCCELLDCCGPVFSPNLYYMRADWNAAGVTDQSSFEAFLITYGYSNINITNFSLVGDILTCDLTADIASTANYSTLRIYEIRGLGKITRLMAYFINFTDFINPGINSGVETFNIVVPGQLNNASGITLYNNNVSTFKVKNYDANTPFTFQFDLRNNQMTFASYNDMLTSVNTWASGTGFLSVIVNFANNIDSVAGTPLETALINKGYIVVS